MVLRLRYSVRSVLGFFAGFILLGVFFFPRFNILGSAKLRLEDFAFLVFLSGAFCLLLRDWPLRMPRIFLPALAYFIYSFLVSLFRAAQGIDHGYFFTVFFGKEFQFLVFALIFYWIFRDSRPKFLLVFAAALISLNVITGLIRLSLNIRAHYGLTALFLEDSPSLSGQIYGLGAIFLVMASVIDRAFRNICTGVLIVMSVFCCVATVSKSSIYGLIAFFVTYLFLRDFYLCRKLRRKVVNFLIWCCAGAAVAVSVSAISARPDKMLFDISLDRLFHPVSSMKARATQDLAPKFSRFANAADWVFGFGYMSRMSGDGRVNFVSDYDNLYVRNMMVIGAAGTLIWALMLGSFTLALRGFPRLHCFYLAFLAYYLVMGFGCESFQLSKSGAVFWIVTGMLLGLAKNPRAAQFLEEA